MTNDDADLESWRRLHGTSDPGLTLAAGTSRLVASDGCCSWNREAYLRAALGIDGPGPHDEREACQAQARAEEQARARLAVWLALHAL